MFPIIAHRAVMGFFITSVTHPRHSSPTLFTAHTSRTHVKALQTDLHAKPDNSSGPTHDSPSERPLRTKVTFQLKTAPKKHREHQAVRRPPKPSTSRLSSMPIQPESRDQGPKGSIETKTASTSMLRAMEEALKASGQNPWLHYTASKPSRLSFDRSRLPIPWGWD